MSKALGNHEFDNGVEGVLPFLQKVNCKVVSANIQADQTLAANLTGLYKPYTVINLGSEKVAVVGYTTAETPFLSMPGKRSNCLQSLRRRSAFYAFLVLFSRFRSAS